MGAELDGLHLGRCKPAVSGVRRNRKEVAMWTPGQIKRPKQEISAMYVDISPDGMLAVLGIGVQHPNVAAVVVCATDTGDIVGSFCHGRGGIVAITYSEQWGAVHAIFGTGSPSHA